jgi:hypothetical protein
MRDTLIRQTPIQSGGSKVLEWKKDVKTSDQEWTPIRVAYGNKNGGIVYCGVITHSEADRNYQGKDFLQKCD